MDLYQELYNIIKSYHPDRVLWVNSLGKAPWHFVDGQLIEGIFGDKNDVPTAEVFAFAVETAKRYQEAVANGKMLCVNPSLETPAAPGIGVPGDDLDRTFFAYAFSRLGKFAIAFRAPYHKGLLNWLRLKNVWGDIIEVKKDVHIRVYDRGIVVLNGTDQAQKVDLPLKSPELQKAGSIIDVRTEKAYPVEAGSRYLEVEIPAYSGRVFATVAAFVLAKEHKLPEKPKKWVAPLSPGVRIAPPEVIFKGPAAFLKWHDEHPDEGK